MSDRPVETPIEQVIEEKPAFFGAPERPIQLPEPPLDDSGGDYGGVGTGDGPSSVATSNPLSYPGYGDGPDWQMGIDTPAAQEYGGNPWLDQLAEARSAGHSWEAIDSHTAAQRGAAYEQGYTQQEIDDYLGLRGSQLLDNRNRVAWGSILSINPDLASTMMSDQPALDLFASPGLRYEYSEALLRGEVRTPLEFAYGYAASALEAAEKALGEVAPGEDTRRWMVAGGAAAEEAAASLPTAQELTDAAVAVSNASGSPIDFVRRKLLETWESTGEPVLEQAKRALTGETAQFVGTAAVRGITGLPDFLMDPLSPLRRIVSPELERIEQGPSRLGRTAGDIVFGLAGEEYHPTTPFGRTLMGAAQGAIGGAPFGPLIAAISAAAGAADVATMEITGSERAAAVAGLAVGLVPPAAVHRVFTRTPQTEVLGSILGEAFTADQRAFWEAFRNNEEFVQAAARGEPIPLESAVLAASEMLRLPYRRPPEDGSPAPPNPPIDIPPMDGGGGAVFDGPMVKLPPLPDVPVIDFDAPPGAPPRMISAKEALVEPPVEPQIISAVAEELSLLSKADRMEALRQENEGLTQGLPMESGSFFSRKVVEMRERGELPEGTQFRGEEPTPQVLLDLAEGHENARTVGNFMQDTFGSLMSDETGAMRNPFAGRTLFPTKEQRETATRVRQEKKAIEGLIIQEQTRGGREIAAADFALKPFRKYVNAVEKPWLDELAKGPMGDPMSTEIGALVNFIEGVGYGPVLRLDQKEGGVAQAIRDQNVRKHQLLMDAFQRGDIPEPGYRDDYFRHLWTDPATAARFFDGYMDAQGGVGKQGSRATLKHRTLPTVADGIRAGLVPAIPNIIELTMYDIESTVKMVHAVRILKEAEKSLGLVHFRTKQVAGEEPLTGVGTTRAVPLQPNVALRRAEAAARDAYDAAAAPFNQRIAKLEADVQALVNRQASRGAITYARQLVADERNNRRATLQPLQEAVARATAAAEPEAMIQQAYAPPHVAKVYNNWLSHGWFSDPATHGTANALMYMKNRMVGLKFALPLFHTWVIGKAVMTTGMQEMLAQLAAGHPLKAVQAGAEGATFFPRAIRTYRRGIKARDDYVKLVDEPLLNQLVDAGLRIGKRQIPYSMGVEQDYYSAIMQNNAGATTMEKAANVFKAAGREVVAKLETVGGPPGEPMIWGNWKSPGTLPMMPLRATKVPVDLMAQALTTISAPLFDHLIPVMKAGAAMQMFETWLDNNRGASPEVVARRAEQIVTDVERRFGEQNLDNIFLPNKLKQAAQFATISVTWALSVWAWTASAVQSAAVAANHLGHFRPPSELAKNPKWDPIALQTFVGSMFTHALVAGALTFAATHEIPKGWDYVFERTGATLPSGLPQRGLNASENKEFVDIGKIVATTLARDKARGVLIPDQTAINRSLAAANDATELTADYGSGKFNNIPHILLEMTGGEDAIGRKPAYMPGGMTRWLGEWALPMVYENYMYPKKGTGLNFIESMISKEAPLWFTDPEAFYGKQHNVVKKWSSEGIRRAIKDNEKLENPKYDVIAPGRRTWSPKQNTRQQTTPKSLRGVKNPNWGR